MTHRSIESQKSRNHLMEGAILGALSVAAAAVLTDVQVGAYHRRGKSESADMVDYEGVDTPHDNYVFSGYHSNGHVIASNMHRHLESLGDVHFGVHPDKGLSIDSYKEVVLERRRQEGHKPARIYAMSMGALIVAKMFSDENFRQQFGEVETLVMDGGLSGKKDVSLSSKAAMALGTILPVTFMTDKLYHYITGQEAKRELDYDPDMVTYDEAHEHIVSSAKTSFDAAKSHILFMNQNSVDQMDLAVFGESITGPIVYLSSPRDDVLNPHRAVQEYSDALQRDIEFWVDTRRALGTHATGPERPQGVIDALLHQNQENYRIKTIRHQMTKSLSGLWLPQAKTA